MNNEEPQLTQIANLQISHEGHKLPEQSQVATTTIPRPFTFMSLINQWQPMGVRVVLNIPFIGNDKDFIFAIRNGPFIPRYDKTYTDAGIYADAGETKDISINSYAFNNMKNVIHATKKWKNPPADVKQSIYITYYDYPPILAQLSMMFRKWRGSMEYRIRTVSGFSTQGYLFAGMIRNSPSYVGIFDQYKVLNSVARQDDSYREVMQNSYISSDTSMFRHFKIHVPYEYPSPWYDQFRWIGNRSRPSELFVSGGSGQPRIAGNKVWNEPHGDNFIVIGMRGALNTSVNQAQISFELEYRAGEDFQFADPGLPVGEFMIPASKKTMSSVQYPDPRMKSDGIGLPTSAAAPAMASRMGNNRNGNRRTREINPEDLQDHVSTLQAREGSAILRNDDGTPFTYSQWRKELENEEGYDTVDDNSSVTSERSRLEDLEGINLRKSLRLRNL
ncbi:putative capsid protein [Solenopsis invicta virus 4]|uniref:Putative capsid protein n=1 Tax=Solenopsis invicta virus 4 TaxID=2018500 RepID=A0A220QTE9_9VIRU|nr:putative capsid protein [Solenopsis invicta virus 4]ASK12193.1 putative capsid protein [Solenopsis invicta virus 4]